MSVAGASTIFFTPISGMLGDSYNKKKLLLIGAVGLAFSNYLFIHFDSLYYSSEVKSSYEIAFKVDLSKIKSLIFINIFQFIFCLLILSFLTNLHIDAEKDETELV